MSDLTESCSTALQVGSEEDYEYVCDLCVADGKRMEAIVYCVDCREKLCNECRNYHKKLPSLRQHVLHDTVTMTMSPKGKKQLPGDFSTADTLTDVCQKHPDEPIKFFCSSHQQLGCSVCVPLHHRTCGDSVSYIRDISTERIHSAEFKKVCSDAKKLVDGLKSSKTWSEQFRQESVNSYAQAVNELKTFRRNINKLLDKLEEDLLNESSKDRKEYLDSLVHLEPKLDDMVKEVSEMVSGFDRKGELKHYDQLFIAMNYAKEKISALEKEATRISATIKPQRFVFIRDSQLDDIISSLTRVGTLSPVGQREVAKYVNAINVQSREDVDICRIRGVVVLTDGRLALADHSNQSVKIINTANKKAVEQVTLRSGPGDITKIGDDKLAVMFYDNNRIQFMSLSPKLAAGRTVTGPGRRYRGIAYNGGKLFLSCFAPVPSVHICNMSGNLLQQIDSDCTGNKLFIEPSGITLNLDGSFIYVSDCKRNKVVCLSREGRVMATYSNDRLKQPRGITVDEGGRVYVCSRDNSCIHQLSPSGQLENVLLEKDGLRWPRAITYDTGKLYISRWDIFSLVQNHSKISVYKLE